MLNGCLQPFEMRLHEAHAGAGTKSVGLSRATYRHLEGRIAILGGAEWS